MISLLINGRKRRDRWWRYHVLREAFVRAQFSGESNRDLGRAFNRLGYGCVPERLLPLWQALVAAGIDSQTLLSKDSLARIDDQVGELSPDLLSPNGWLDLFRLCIGIGLFQPSRELRELGLERMQMDASRSSAKLKQKILGCYASVEIGQYSEARQFVAEMARSGCSDSRLVQADWFVSLLSGECGREPWDFGLFVAGEEREFGRFVRDQKIALVGPVASDVTQGPDIDDHDVVVKFGYRGGEKGRDPETQGGRLDISYYNNVQAEQLSASAYDQVFSTIRWGVCNTRKGRSYFPSTYPGLRQIASLQWLLPDTHLNAGPNAILDLLKFGPKKIKIFNTDMMLSSGRFAGYKSESDKPIDYTRSFIKTHDPILQYQIMHRLWTVGHIVGDARFESVMKMGLHDYLDQLQQAYGADTRALI